MKDRAKWEWGLLVGSTLSFFFEGWVAWLLWNGVGKTLLRLPTASYWQILGLTILITFLLPSNKALYGLMKLIAFDKEGRRKP